MEALPCWNIFQHAVHYWSHYEGGIRTTGGSLTSTWHIKRRKERRWEQTYNMGNIQAFSYGCPVGTMYDTFSPLTIQGSGSPASKMVWMAHWTQDFTALTTAVAQPGSQRTWTWLSIFLGTKRDNTKADVLLGLRYKSDTLYLSIWTQMILGSSQCRQKPSPAWGLGGILKKSWPPATSHSSLCI